MSEKPYFVEKNGEWSEVRTRGSDPTSTPWTVFACMAELTAERVCTLLNNESALAQAALTSLRAELKAAVAMRDQWKREAEAARAWHGYRGLNADVSADLMLAHRKAWKATDDMLAPDSTGAVGKEGESEIDPPPCPVCGSKYHGASGHTPQSRLTRGAPDAK